jgi:signal transduction histidine kinase
MRIATRDLPLVSRLTVLLSGHSHAEVQMSLLSNFTIRTKLVSMVAVSAIAVCAVIAVAASLSQKRMMEDRILQLRTAIDLVTGLAHRSRTRLKPADEAAGS